MGNHLVGVAVMPCRAAVRAAVVVGVIPPTAERRWRAAIALSGGCLSLVKEPPHLLLRGVEGRLGHCRRHWRHRAGGLAPAGVGGAVAKRPLLAILSELAVNTMVAPGGRLCGGDGAVERPRRSESVSLGTHPDVTPVLANAYW